MIASALERLPEHGLLLDVGGWARPLARADWVIDLGPEGGAEGGEIIAEGQPDAVAQTPGSYTGKFLAELLPKLNGKR